MSDSRGRTFTGAAAFAVVGLVALILLWPRPAQPAELARPAPIEQSVIAPFTALGVATSADQPGLVPLGAEPPEGVDPDTTYKRRQFEDFLSRQTGEPMRVTDAYESSGSQVTTYCGSAMPIAGGAARSWGIVLWSHASMEHSISNEPAECSGLVLIKDGRVFSRDEARATREAELVPYRQVPAAPMTRAQSSDPGSIARHIDRLSTYAVLIGRGAACGADIAGPSRRVGVWLDRVGPRGSDTQRTLLPMFMQQSRYHAEMQASGRSPDDCGAVRRAVANHPWP